MSVANLSEALNAEGCLFCRAHDGGFTSVEHIISEGLGNLDRDVLPPGVVCDRCNNGPLARADRGLTDFEPIQLLRGERGLPTRSGNAVLSQWREGSFAYTAPGELSIFGEGASPLKQVGPNRFQTHLTTTSRFKAKRAQSMLRGVWKSVIEYVYLDMGSDVAFAPIFDGARSEVLGQGDGKGWMAVPKDAVPSQEVRTRYWPIASEGAVALPAVLDVFGVQFWTDPIQRNLSREDVESMFPLPVNAWIFPHVQSGAPPESGAENG